MNKTILAIIVVSVISVIGLAFAIPAFGRYQARAEAENQVQINEIVIKQQAQNIKVEKQKAQIRIVDAQGIAKSQKIIAKSLTDAYLQYLSIQAQQAMANGVNHTEIYIPTGQNGIPLVRTTN